MTIGRKSSGYDPAPKKRRKALILLILAFLGLSKEEDIPPSSSVGCSGKPRRI